MTRRPLPLRGFTLVELLVAMSILALLVVLLSSIVSATNRAWIAGEQQVSEFQDGRAILELISRELSQAVISPSLQLIYDPPLSGMPQRANSDCIFWQAPITSSDAGSLAEVGYYLSENSNNAGADVYQLKRFFVPPDSTDYSIFTSAGQPTDTSSPWVTNYIAKPSLTSTVANGVLAFWARCLDSNGDSIPWATSAGGRFNSAAHFQSAIPAQPNSFKYTGASTARANLLPYAVELTIVTLDSKTFSRKPTIPALTAETGPDDISSVRDAFNQALIASNVRNARTFTTRVLLRNH